MTRPLIPHATDTPDVDLVTTNDLHALYHEGSVVEPESLLDRRILAAAKAEVANDRRRSRASPPWWKVLLVPAMTAAIGVLGISLAWRVVDHEERELRAAMNAAETQPRADEAQSGTVTVPVPARVTPTPSPSPKAVVPTKPRSEAKIADQAVSVEAQQKKSSNEAVQGATSPMSAAKPSRDNRSVEKEGSAKVEAPGVPDDAEAPEDWFKRIRELRAAGRDAEAAQSLARFRLRYPDHVVPGDLVQPK